MKPQAFLTLGALLDDYLQRLTPGALEATTEHCVRVHVRHFKRTFGEKLPLRLIDLSAVQACIDKRAQADGLNGRKLSTTTIKKEIATLSMIWSWAESHEYVTRPLPKKGIRYPKQIEKPPFQTIAEIERKIDLGRSDAEAAELWDAAFLTLPEVAEVLSFVKERALHPFL